MPLSARPISRFAFHLKKKELWIFLINFLPLKVPLEESKKCPSNLINVNNNNLHQNELLKPLCGWARLCNLQRPSWHNIIIISSSSNRERLNSTICLMHCCKGNLHWRFLKLESQFWWKKSVKKIRVSIRVYDEARKRYQALRY